MSKLQAKDLWSLERYARERPAFRTKVLEHKRDRKLAVGPSTMWCFEDRLTVQYQVQEMLRAERIFEPEGIQDELDAYNPLIPDGTNWKVTLLIEFPDEEERRRQLAALRGIEDRAWVQVEGHDRVYAIADEDMERENEEKTSSVHFLRFELDPAQVASLRAGRSLGVGIEHPSYSHAIAAVPEAVRLSLLADFLKIQ
jgi:hypothetical protein